MPLHGFLGESLEGLVTRMLIEKGGGCVGLQRLQAIVL